jgi:hypothetical protein
MSVSPYTTTVRIIRNIENCNSRVCVLLPFEWKFALSLLVLWHTVMHQFSAASCNNSHVYYSLYIYVYIFISLSLPLSALILYFPLLFCFNSLPMGSFLVMVRLWLGLALLMGMVEPSIYMYT